MAKQNVSGSLLSLKASFEGNGKRLITMWCENVRFQNWISFMGIII